MDQYTVEIEDTFTERRRYFVKASSREEAVALALNSKAGPAVSTRESHNGQECWAGPRNSGTLDLVCDGKRKNPALTKSLQSLRKAQP